MYHVQDCLLHRKPAPWGSGDWDFFELVIRIILNEVKLQNYASKKSIAMNVRNINLIT